MILITGGAGFIGSNIAAALDEADEEIVICDRLRAGDKWRNLAHRRLHRFVLPHDLFDYLRDHSDEVDAVVHMGAISSTTVTDGDEVMRNNFGLSVDLWNWCTEHEVRFIYASSAATYGDGSAGFNDDWDETSLSLLRPLNLYGWSKHVFDRFVARQMSKGQPTPPQWVGLKFFNVYGPNEGHKGTMQSVIAQLYPKLNGGEPARLFKSYREGVADGEQLRDFIYVGDCVSVVTWLLSNPSACGIFNLGTGQARSFADLALATQRAMNLEPRIEFIEMPLELRSKYQYFTQARMSALRTLGYEQAFTDLESGVGEYVRNFLSTNDPYR